MELAGTRIAIEGISPAIDGGRFAARAVAGVPLEVEADIFSDGHEVIAAALLWRRSGDSEWQQAPMRHVTNDR